MTTMMRVEDLLVGDSVAMFGAVVELVSIEPSTAIAGTRLLRIRPAGTDTVPVPTLLPASWQLTTVTAMRVVTRRCILCRYQHDELHNVADSWPVGGICAACNAASDRRVAIELG